MFARALRWRVSAYDEFLFVGALELDPCAASPAGFVSGIPLFTDNPFQTATKRRSEEHTSELQSLTNLVCRLLLEKKKCIRQCVFRGQCTCRGKCSRHS